jgi:hypothetical protein
LAFLIIGLAGDASSGSTYELVEQEIHDITMQQTPPRNFRSREVREGHPEFQVLNALRSKGAKKFHTPKSQQLKLDFAGETPISDDDFDAAGYNMEGVWDWKLGESALSFPPSHVLLCKSLLPANGFYDGLAEESLSNNMQGGSARPSLFTSPKSRPTKMKMCVHSPIVHDAVLCMMHLRRTLQQDPSDRESLARSMKRSGRENTSRFSVCRDVTGKYVLT